MKIINNKKYCIIFLAFLLAVVIAAPAMAAFGNSGPTESGQRSMGNADNVSSGIAGQGKDTQTILPVLYGLFGIVTILVAVILYIVFVKQKRSTAPGEEIKTDIITNKSPKTVSGTIKDDHTNFPPELLTRYSDVQLVGKGGLSSVFSAKIKETDETVAIKIPVLNDEKSGSVFLQEIKIWEDLSHPNIVSVRSVNVFPVPYVEMEYVEDSLSDLKVPLKPDIALHIITGILRGLSYAHNKGIIHCDIKPGNILIDGDFTPKIADWGVGKHIDKITGISGYTPAFAAPEQISSDLIEKCTVRTDIYQAGMLLYWMLSGKNAFEERLSGTKTKPDEIIPKNPLSESGDDQIESTRNSEINKIVRKCIQNNPEMRYQSADELLSVILSLSGSTIIN